LCGLPGLAVAMGLKSAPSFRKCWTNNASTKSTDPSAQESAPHRKT
jgi:hypothetical protein